MYDKQWSVSKTPWKTFIHADGRLKMQEWKMRGTHRRGMENAGVGLISPMDSQPQNRLRQR